MPLYAESVADLIGQTPVSVAWLVPAKIADAIARHAVYRRCHSTGRIASASLIVLATRSCLLCACVTVLDGQTQPCDSGNQG